MPPEERSHNGHNGRDKKPSEHNPAAHARALGLPVHEEIITHLTAHAAELGLSGKSARDTIKIELLGFLLDKMHSLPPHGRAIAKELSAKRMRIVDQLRISNMGGRANLEEMLRIFRDLRGQLECSETLPAQLGIAEQAHAEVAKALDSEIEACERAVELRASIGAGFVLKAPQGGIRTALLNIALAANTTLFIEALGGRENFDALNSVLARVIKEYVNPHFPDSPDDLSDQFRRRM